MDDCCVIFLSSHEFPALLSGGGLCDTKKIKVSSLYNSIRTTDNVILYSPQVKLSQTTDLNSALKVLVNNIHLASE